MLFETDFFFNFFPEVSQIWYIRPIRIQIEFRNLQEKLEKQISTNFQEKIRANQLTMEKKS